MNGNPIREFQSIDIFRLIKNRLTKNPNLNNIITNVDSLSTISEATFNKKSLELAKVYRNINFENNVQKIDFTIGFVSLEYFEEREKLKREEKCQKNILVGLFIFTTTDYPAEKIVASLAEYITRLEQEQFTEFSNLMERVRVSIVGKEKEKPLVKEDEVKQIYEIIDTMKPLHKSGFDLFGGLSMKCLQTRKRKRNLESILPVVTTLIFLQITSQR